MGVHWCRPFSQKPCGPNPSTLLRHLGQVSPFIPLTWQWESLMTHLAERRRKDRNASERVAKKLWDHAKPQQHGLVFPLCSLEWKVDFSSFPLTPTSPPSSRLLAVPALTSRDNSQIASFSDNKIQQPFGISVCPSLLTPGWVPEDLWSAANQSPGHSHFPWHSWNSPTACPLGVSYPARLKLFAPLPPCPSLPLP